MGGKSSRDKGKAFESEIVSRFRLAGWLGAKRHLEFQTAEAKGYDLDNTEPFRIQCKAYASYAPISCLNEVHRAPGVIPVLITKGDSAAPVAVLPFKDFMTMVTTMRNAGLVLAPPTAEDFA